MEKERALGGCHRSSNPRAMWVPAQGATKRNASVEASRRRIFCLFFHLSESTSFQMFRQTEAEGVKEEEEKATDEAFGIAEADRVTLLRKGELNKIEGIAGGRERGRSPRSREKPVETAPRERGTATRPAPPLSTLSPHSLRRDQGHDSGISRRTTSTRG